MPFYTFVPEDSVAVVDGEVAQGVNFTGIDPAIHAVQWYNVSGNIEYDFDPITGEKQANQQITDVAAFQSYITQAEEIIFAQNNPVTYWVTADQTLYAGGVYLFGDPIVISTPNPVQPAYTTVIVPSTPESWQELFWYDDAWVISSVNPALPLADAQSFLIASTQTSAAEQGNNEARIYSTAQLFAAADVDTLLTADYPLVTLGDYQIFLDGQVTTLEATINVATTTEELYNFDPSVSGLYA